MAGCGDWFDGREEVPCFWLGHLVLGQGPWQGEYRFETQERPLATPGGTGDGRAPGPQTLTHTLQDFGFTKTPQT